MPEISLSQGQIALVDDEDYEPISAWRWLAQWSPTARTFYVVRAGEKRRNHSLVYMHNEILRPAPGCHVDHRNHVGTDNRRENLRIGTRSQNLANQRPQSGRSSRYKGVSWNEKGGKWHAYITVDRKRRHLGVFTEEIDAARAYDTAAVEAFGEFAYLNLVTSDAR